MTRKITIHDIAKQAGVSAATVSRVINHKPDVDPITRERILRIIHEQGFVPSMAATGLAGGRSHLIGVLIPSLTWPLIPEIMRGVAEVIEPTTYELVLYSISNSNHEKDRSDVIDNILATRLVAGLLAMYPGQSVHHLKDLHQQGFPLVMIDDQGPPPENIPWVGADQIAGAYKATRHLIQQGHRRIAHIQGPLKYQVSLDRYQGYCQALEEADIKLDSRLVIAGDFLPPGGKECASYLFSLDERPTAIFAGNDLMAFGAMSAAEQYKIRIPEDVAIVGFDDITLSAHMQPALTTIRQPLVEMGKHAIELLLQIVNLPRPLQTSFVLSQSHHHTEKAAHVRFPTDLVVRYSCGSATNSHIKP